MNQSFENIFSKTMDDLINKIAEEQKQHSAKVHDFVKHELNGVIDKLRIDLDKHTSIDNEYFYYHEDMTINQNEFEMLIDAFYEIGERIDVDQNENEFDTSYIDFDDIRMTVINGQGTVWIFSKLEPENDTQTS